jgi:crossover junction endodeoxyribonuclease RuvC
MIVIGIDPGIATTGCAVIEDKSGVFKLLFSTAIITPVKSENGERLSMIYEKLSDILSKYKPQYAGLETLFFSRNVTTAFTVGQARGVVLLSLSQKKIPTFEYAPVKVKSAICGYGQAEKGQVSRMVKHLLHLPKTLTPDDVSDAAAIALTHCFSYKINKFLK